MRDLFRALCLAALAALAGCDLEEITIVEIEDVVIAEIYVNLAKDSSENEVRALLHGTVGGLGSILDRLVGVRIVVSRSDGLTLELVENELEACLEPAGEEEGEEPEIGEGICFFADPAQTPELSPGDLLEVVVTFADGGTILGAARVPASFEIDGIPSTCRLDPDTLLPLLWSSSEGAWAYFNETSIIGLREALSAEGIPVEDDPLTLLGLSVSNQDTTTVFPSEFGVFDRFDLDSDLSVRLQTGLPPETSAEVSITAVDGNFVNWARGGSFNPSGLVRVPSLRGDGTGVFGATVNRRFFLFSSDQMDGVPDCLIP
jgi:hypothetical protein